MNEHVPVIGIIGGSGLYQMEELCDTAETKLTYRLDRRQLNRWWKIRRASGLFFAPDGPGTGSA